MSAFQRKKTYRRTLPYDPIRTRRRMRRWNSNNPSDDIFGTLKMKEIQIPRIVLYNHVFKIAFHVKV